ncbi:MAG: ABC transporter ATP-binding protein [candidate division WOR-3 bacterium]
MNKNIIKAELLVKTYKMGNEVISAVADVSVNIEQGKFYAFVGPSGSGKSTLLNLLGALDTPDSGRLIIGNEEIYNINIKRKDTLQKHQNTDDIKRNPVKENIKISQKTLTAIRRKYFGFVFQNFHLLPTLTVIENICLPLLFTKKKIDSEQINKILSKLGLEGRGRHLPSQLSGGEMQRVALGRALAVNPQIIIADEPTGNLDSKNATLVFDIFKKLSEEGITVLSATHDVQLVQQFSDKIIRLKDGKIVEGEAAV